MNGDLGTGLGIVLAFLAILGAAWRWVVLPNLREQLIKPLEQTRIQVTENKHRNNPPTIRDQLDDLANHVDLLALNQLAMMRQLGLHIGESGREHERLWLIVESLVHEDHQTGRKHDGKQRRDT